MIISITPVRGGSKRIPRKNMLEINGETLIARKIRQLKDAGVNKVIVGSDDQEMLDETQKHGGIPIRRTATNEGVVSANMMIGEMMELIDANDDDIIVWAHCTNPCIDGEEYRKAIDLFVGNYPTYDSLISVAEVKEHLWDNTWNPMYDTEHCRNVKHILAGEMKPIYKQDGGIFIQYYRDMKRNSYFFGEHPYLYVMPESKVCDINVPIDVEIARLMCE